MYVLLLYAYLMIDYYIEDELIVAYMRCVTSPYNLSYLSEEVSGWEAKECIHRCKRYGLLEFKGEH